MLLPLAGAAVWDYGLSIGNRARRACVFAEEQWPLDVGCYLVAKPG